MRLLILLTMLAASASAELVVCVAGGKLNFSADACPANGRQKATPPMIDRRVSVASATRSPWINSNGWRYRRNPDARFLLEAPAGTAVRAAAEAAAFGADLRLVAQDQERAALEQLAALLAQLPSRSLADVADFAFLDDGSAATGEILNLFTRRNLLFRLARDAKGQKGTVIRIGSGEFTKEAAQNPSEFAYLVRKKIGDDKRSLRIYGTEMTIARLLADNRGARLHLVNYNDRPADGIRIRVRAKVNRADGRVLGKPDARIEEIRRDGEYSEFTISEVGTYAVVDLW